MNKNLIKEVYKHPLISEKEMELLIDNHKFLEIKKDEYLLKPNQIANEYYILESGLARSFLYDYNDNEITTGFFAKNEIIIEVSSLFQRKPTNEYIQTLTDCFCWKINFNDFQKLFHEVKGFREWGRAWMSESLFQLKKHYISFVQDDATSRYKKLLEEKPEILQTAQLKQIASHLGITDTSLSRIRKQITKS